MNIQNTACFTGHRPAQLHMLNDRTGKCYRLLSDLLDYYIVLLHEKNGVVNFISGMALGVDLLAAERVLAIRDSGVPIRLVCAIPCLRQEYRWGEEDKERYRLVRERADEVIYTGKEYTSDCMHKRNRFMVQNSSHCIAVWNGNPGGTSSTVNAALKKKLHLIRIDPTDFTVTENADPMQINVFEI